MNGLRVFGYELDTNVLRYSFALSVRPTWTGVWRAYIRIVFQNPLI